MWTTTGLVKASGYCFNIVVVISVVIRRTLRNNHTGLLVSFFVVRRWGIHAGQLFPRITAVVSRLACIALKYLLG